MQMDGILLVHKKAGCTSFDVVQRCRKIFMQKSVGHTGTLDPNATGVLIVLLGKACKCLPYLVHDQKEYIAEMKLGEKYDTGDCWGNIIETKPVPSYTEEELKQIFASLIGKSMQLPPMVSAVKVNGRKLYEYAREGKEVLRQEREIEIFEMELLEYQNGIRFRCVCSSGTYIRTLCEEIAEKLGTVGTMTSLIRTKAGGFSLEECIDLDKLELQNVKLYSVTDILKKLYPCVEAENPEDIKNGKRIKIDRDEELLCITCQNEAMAMYERVEEGLYKSKRGLW